MKITVKYDGQDEFELDENLAGITVAECSRSGKLRVAHIFSVSLISDDQLFVLADPVKPKVDPSAPVREEP